MNNLTTVELLGQDDLIWDYSEKPPKYRTLGWRTVDVDPCISYHHDVGLVEETLARVVDVWPNPVPIRVVVLSHEEVGRNNGHSTFDRKYYSSEPGDPFDHVIVLCGKRIPIHPAMTRYLVAHEYGHHVQYWVQQQMGYDADRSDLFEDEIYAPLREMEHVNARPGWWHLATGEVFANDFRHLMAGIECEFWPHEVPKPNLSYRLWRWWQETLERDYSNVSRTPPKQEDDG